MNKYQLNDCPFKKLLFTIENATAADSSVIFIQQNDAKTLTQTKVMTKK